MVLDRFRKRLDAGATAAGSSSAALRASLEAALPPATALVYDGLDPQLSAAAAALAAGDPAPIGSLLAATRAGQLWDRRSRAVASAARQAVGDPLVVRRWLESTPQDPDAAVVAAALHMQLAWRARPQAPEADQGAFHGLLAEALPLIGHALAVNPADPVIYEVALDHARAMGAAREVFYDLCQRADAVALYHLGWQSAALRFLSPRWHGSPDEAWLYADAVSEDAPVAARVALLPVLALSEIWRDDVARFGSAGGPGRAFVLERIDAAVQRAHAHLSAPTGPTGPTALTGTGAEPVDRIEAIAVVAHLLGQAGRDAEAYDAYLALGPHVTVLPWGSYMDPVSTFTEFRQDAVHARAALG